MPTSDEVDKIKIKLRQIENRLSALATQDIDLRKRRVINASPSIKSDDYVTREELVKLRNSLREEVAIAETPQTLDPVSLALAAVDDIPAGHRASFGEGTPGGIENPRYTIDHAGTQIVGLCIEITPPKDQLFHHALLTLDPEQDGEDKINQGNHAPPDSGYTLGDPYYAVIWYKRPEANQTWDIEGHSIGSDGKLLYAASKGTILSVSVTAIEGVGYPTIGTIVEQDVSNWDTPYTQLTIPYTAPSSGSFVGFTVFRKKSTEADTEYRDEAFNDHPGGLADGETGEIIRTWEREASDVTWDIVLSPHTKWEGHRLLIAGDARNKGSVLIEAPGAPSATGITDAAISNFAYDWNLRDEYGHPSFSFELTYTHPSNDSNFFHSYCTVQLVNAAGTGIPGHPFGIERHFGGDGYPGKSVTITPPGNWGPVGHPVYNRFRIKIYNANRKEERTLQTSAFGAGVSYYDIITTDQIGYPTLGTITQQGQLKDGFTPYTQVTFPWTAPSEGSLKAITLYRSVDGGDYEIVMNIDTPNGADGGSYSFSAILPTPITANETWEFVLAPHTSWIGSILLVASDNRNYDSITVNKIGPPADGKITDAAITDWSLTGTYDDYGFPTFNGVVNYTNPDDDSNFMHSEVTIQLVNSSGVGVPYPNALGIERKFAGGSGPGIGMEFAFGPWGPVGHSVYNRFRFKVYTVNRLGDRTQQTTAWAGAAYYDLVTSDPGKTLNPRRLNSAYLGDGITQDGSDNLTVDLGNGVTISSGKIVVNTSGGGLAFSSGKLVVDPDTTKGLEISGGKLVAKVGGSNSIEVDGSGYLKVKYNGTNFTTDGSGNLLINGVQAAKVLAGDLIVGVTIAAANIRTGSLAAGVVYTGTLVASQVISGQFSGISLTLTSGGITTLINNVYDGDLNSSYLGIRVYKSSTQKSGLGYDGTYSRDGDKLGYYAAGTFDCAYDYNTGGTGRILTALTSNAADLLFYGQGIGSYGSACVRILAYGSGSYIDLPNGGSYKIGGSNVINSSGQFVGPGVITTGGGIGGTGYGIYQSGWFYGVTGPTSFTTTDGKTVTVRGGIIISIV